MDRVFDLRSLVAGTVAALDPARPSEVSRHIRHRDAAALAPEAVPSRSGLGVVSGRPKYPSLPFDVKGLACRSSVYRLGN